MKQGVKNKIIQYITSHHITSVLIKLRNWFWWSVEDSFGVDPSHEVFLAEKRQKEAELPLLQQLAQLVLSGGQLVLGTGLDVGGEHDKALSDLNCSDQF